ncbi:MAG TPA: lipid-A-disaccharide synthase N-terminal domain-containing protein [Phycisphaerae bacterium]|nr:lipid-A-disaccharide synthase N-terminal domain-containing protein [Phycisphaerae bacterium]
MLQKLLANLDVWAVLGFVAQAFFAGRFLVQWIASERAGRSVIPVVFWYLSLAGSAGLLVYAIVRADPVFILAYLFNGFVYIRNLMLLRAEAQRQRVS